MAFLLPTLKALARPHRPSSFFLAGFTKGWLFCLLLRLLPAHTDLLSDIPLNAAVNTTIRNVGGDQVVLEDVQHDLLGQRLNHKQMSKLIGGHHDTKYTNKQHTIPDSKLPMYMHVNMCMVRTFSRVWINRGMVTNPT